MVKIIGDALVTTDNFLIRPLFNIVPVEIDNHKISGKEKETRFEYKNKYIYIFSFDTFGTTKPSLNAMV